MTEIQYLKTRIQDLEKNIQDPNITPEEQKRQAIALVNYRLDLKRALNNQKFNQER